jgi:PBP1b-binding outer membrane lipoprotein LpoB
MWAGELTMRIIIALTLIALTLSACAGGPAPLAHVKYRGCVNHDIHDFHGSNAQQDC